MKKIIFLFVMFLTTFVAINNALAQNNSFVATRASQEKRWAYTKTEFGTATSSKLILKQVKDQFGVPTSLQIDKNGSFMWNITTTKGNTTSPGNITGESNEVVFEFSSDKKLKANITFYKTEMFVMFVGKTDAEYVMLNFKKEE